MPSEADILAPPQRVTERIDRWETFLDGVVPTKKDGVGANLLIATWNLRAFSDLTKPGPHRTAPRRSGTSPTST
ncbi:hypothetical protein ACFYXF_33060 [Streptomyces sp. NPDC002680]|uniref:hypothetical protein n=1 Tax=Streptomyces sp. NPDC002680 TaxID=3364659 RepID=UPI0036AB88BF